MSPHLETDPAARSRTTDTTSAPAADRPATLAEALGKDGPGITAEIEAELAGDGDTELGILSQLPVTVSARLGATLQSLETVLSLQPGEILHLGRAPGDTIELTANGVVVAYGEVVAVGSSIGVRITALART